MIPVNRDSFGSDVHLLANDCMFLHASYLVHAAKPLCWSSPTLPQPDWPNSCFVSGFKASVELWTQFFLGALPGFVDPKLDRSTCFQCWMTPANAPPRLILCPMAWPLQLTDTWSGLFTALLSNTTFLSTAVQPSGATAWSWMNGRVLRNEWAANAWPRTLASMLGCFSHTLSCHNSKTKANFPGHEMIKLGFFILSFFQKLCSYLFPF